MVYSRVFTQGAFVWDQSGLRIIGIMRVNVCLGAILIPEYLEFILAILLPGAEQPEYIPEYILIPEYSQTNAPLIKKHLKELSLGFKIFLMLVNQITTREAFWKMNRAIQARQFIFIFLVKIGKKFFFMRPAFLFDCLFFQCSNGRMKAHNNLRKTGERNRK